MSCSMPVWKSGWKVKSCNAAEHDEYITPAKKASEPADNRKTAYKEADQAAKEEEKQ